MNLKQWVIVGVATVMSFLVGVAFTAQPQTALVRLADLEIDPGQLQRYLEIVKEEMETSVRVEPGVLALYALAEKDRPNRLRFLEIYADDEAYKSHIQSPHFKSYFTSTQSMITSRNLIEAVPVQLSDKTPGRYAQAAAKAAPPAIYIAEFEVTDPAGLKPYSARVQSTLEPFGGRFIKRGGAIAALEGDAPKGMVMIAFDSMEKAQAWYDSPAYREIRPIRHRSAKTRAYIAEGTGG
jgi:uncharacterized protein (DUF1330 family)/quinol monooxygenase YgiN